MEESSQRAVVIDMLYYYLYELVRSGVKDPLQVVATELPTMINCSAEQVEYVELNLNKNNISERLESSISILKIMKDSNKIDKEGLDLVIKVISDIKQDFDRVAKQIKDAELGDEEDEQGETEGNQ